MIRPRACGAAELAGVVPIGRCCGFDRPIDHEWFFAGQPALKALQPPASFHRLAQKKLAARVTQCELAQPNSPYSGPLHSSHAPEAQPS